MKWLIGLSVGLLVGWMMGLGCAPKTKGENDSTLVLMSQPMIDAEYLTYEAMLLIGSKKDGVSIACTLMVENIDSIKGFMLITPNRVCWIDKKKHIMIIDPSDNYYGMKEFRDAWE
jgi:hypothetical protein